MLALNKWDVTHTDLEDAKARVARKLRLRPQVMTVSAQTGRDVTRLLAEALALADRAAERIPTPELNRFLGRRAGPRQPPAARGKRLRIYYMTQVEDAPAALRDPGQRPRPDHPRLRLLPREPAARALRASRECRS